MVQWGPGPDALFMVNMMKVHDIKPNYPAIAASMGGDFTHRALGHRMDSLRVAAEKYEETMALQARATAQAILNSPAKETKRGPSTRSMSLTTTKTAASKDKGTKSSPLKPITKAGVKKRGAPAKKGKVASKAEPKGKQVEKLVEEDDEDSDATVTDVEMDFHGEDEAEHGDNVTMEGV